MNDTVKFIDAHQHLSFDWGCGSIEEIVSLYRTAGRGKVCLSACGELYGQPENPEVVKAFNSYPGDIIGFAYFRLGTDRPEMVDSFYSSGFRGLKIINPKKAYNSREYYPVYERASHFRMPILFHTGVVARFPKDREFDTDSERMRPIYLDAIARAFPDLYLIGGHLGGPWFQEACSVARVNPNVFFDLSGVIHRFCDIPASFFENMFSWNRARSKLVFGVDGPYERIQEIMGAYDRFLENLKFSSEERHDLFYGHMARILDIG